MNDIEEAIKIKNVQRRMKVKETCGICGSGDLGMVFSSRYCNSCGAIEE